MFVFEFTARQMKKQRLAGGVTMPKIEILPNLFEVWKDFLSY
jgi:hypothetical protein